MPLYLKLVKTVTFMSCIFYHNKKTKTKQISLDLSSQGNFILQQCVDKFMPKDALKTVEVVVNW